MYMGPARSVVGQYLFSDVHVKDMDGRTASFSGVHLLVTSVDIVLSVFSAMSVGVQDRMTWERRAKRNVGEGWCSMIAGATLVLMLTSSVTFQ
jgi:hypothetical protein